MVQRLPLHSRLVHDDALSPDALYVRGSTNAKLTVNWLPRSVKCHRARPIDALLTFKRFAETVLGVLRARTSDYGCSVFLTG